GILGMHNIVKRAVVIGDEVAVRPMMYVALSYDHRVVDGREAVSFLVAVKERLEAPDRMLLEVCPGSAHRADQDRGASHRIGGGGQRGAVEHGARRVGDAGDEAARDRGE